MMPIPKVLAYSHSAGNGVTPPGNCKLLSSSWTSELGLDEINVTTGASEALEFCFCEHYGRGR